MKNVPDFSAARPKLQALVDANGRASVHVFCIVGQRSGSGVEWADVHWPTQNKLIL